VTEAAQFPEKEYINGIFLAVNIPDCVAFYVNCLFLFDLIVSNAMLSIQEEYAGNIFYDVSQD
jgi:hypothetical protein